jgi:hypothetical protein
MGISDGRLRPPGTLYVVGRSQICLHVKPKDNSIEEKYQTCSLLKAMILHEQYLHIQYKYKTTFLHHLRSQIKRGA